MKLRFTPGFVAAVVLFTLLGGAGAASATCGGGTVIPGGLVCLQPFYATTFVGASGESDVNVRFTVTQGGTTILNQGSATSFSGSWNSTLDPGLFPGYFVVCAQRGSQHSTSAEVTLCIDGN